MLKASALFYVHNPRQAGFRACLTVIAMDSHGWVFLVSGWVFLAGAGHSTESLILAQDERWRRA